MNSNDSRDGVDALRMVCESDRFRPYRQAHGRLRRVFATVLGRSVRVEPHSANYCQLAIHLSALLDLYVAHQSEEDMWLHAPLRQVAPRALLAFDTEHEDQLEAIAAMRPLLAELEQGTTQAASISRELELRLSHFIAESLAHMADEETTLTRVLWQHFTDEQLRSFASQLRATAFDRITTKRI